MLRRLLLRALTRLFLPRLLAGTLPSRIAALLHGALHQNPDLVRTYNAARRSERLAGGDLALSVNQRELLEALVLDAATNAEPTHAASKSLHVFSGALSAACVLAFLLLPQAAHRSTDEEAAFAMGDLDTRSARIAEHPVGLKVTCVHNANVVASATAGARQTGETLPCPRGGLLAFSTTNLGPTTRHVYAVGIAGDGSFRWYEPFTRGSGSIDMPAGAINNVLPALADTTSMPSDTHIALFVLISDHPFLGSAVERQVVSAAKRGVPVASLEKLPLVDVPMQARIEVIPADGGP